jgi:8-oxo-dGTP pyrophosphatase MutT (NUDIX family)
VSAVSDQRQWPDPSRWILHGRRTVLEDEWLKLSMVDVELPDGRRFEHHVVRLHSASMVVILDDRDRVLLMWRHRFVPDAWSWEIPGGLIDAGETPEEAAIREAREETGFSLKSVEHLLTFHPAIGTVDCAYHIFLGKDPEFVGKPTDVTEMHHFDWFPQERITELIQKRRLVSSGALVALLYLLATRNAQG